MKLSSLLRCLLASGFLVPLASSARAELVATFTRDGVSDSRLDRLPALALEPGEPATPFLAPGAFDVVWQGKLTLPKRLRLVFSFEGEGIAKLKIDGKEVLAVSGDLAGKVSKSIRLNPGEHEFELSYGSKPDGSGVLRIYWQEKSFVRQTIPPSSFAAVPTAEVVKGELARRGRELFATQNCLKCHSAVSGFGASSMPEVSEFAPLLFDQGERTSEEWLRKWIAAPQALRPSATMPTLVDVTTAEGRQSVSDLAAYVASLKIGTPVGAAPDPTLAEEGGLHFHELGCVACHNLPDKGLADPDRVPLDHVASKYLPGALVAFLKQPDAHNLFSKMPDFHLSDAEADSLAAYLTQASTGQETKTETEFPAGDAARGAAVAASLQCGVCHPGMPLSPDRAPATMDEIFKSDWTATGCVATADKRGNAPQLSLADDDRAALVAFSKLGHESLGRDNAAEYATRQIEALRCTACHGIDHKPALLSSVHLESAALAAHAPHLAERVDQSRPALTFTGEMLYTTAIRAMLDGSADPGPRPWLAMRMPAFKAPAPALAKGISKLHGVLPNTPAVVEVDPTLAEIGEDLAGTTGFGCTTCHAVGDAKATAAFEVEGVNFSLVPDRIRADYYHRWMDNPKSVTPLTKMPSYSKDGKSPRVDVLGGDAAKQFEAIWQYIHRK